MIKLTTPEGIIYIRRSAIIAINEADRVGANSTVVKSQVWIEGLNDCFNVLEDAESIHKELLLEPVNPKSDSSESMVEGIMVISSDNLARRRQKT